MYYIKYPTAPTGAPGTPTSSAATSRTLTLDWTAIACLMRNGAITNYIIQYGEGSNRNETVDMTSTSLTFMVQGLKPFTEYTFTVAGVNSVNTGPMSDASELIRTNEDGKYM